MDAKTIHERIMNPALLNRALAEAARRALQRHKRAGVPAVVWRDGMIVTLEPEDIVVEEETAQGRLPLVPVHE